MDVRKKKRPRKAKEQKNVMILSTDLQMHATELVLNIVTVKSIFFENVPKIPTTIIKIIKKKYSNIIYEHLKY